MKKAVIAFGRFNPISIGHEKLANKIDSEAKKRGASARLYMSHSQDKKKNPLDYNTKINLGKRAFGKMVTKSSARNIIEILKQLESEGFTDVTIIGGSDRVPEFTTLVNKYNGKEYNIPTISVVSAGERDPDAEGVEGMSASKLRGLAQAGEFEKFKQGVPSKFSKNDILKMYNTIRSVMEEMEDDFTDQELDDFLEEIGNTLEDDDDSFEFDDEELDDEISEERKPLTLQQRMKRRMMFKRLAPRIQRARKIKARRMAQKPQLIKRSRKAALSLLKKRAAGDRGKNYAALSPSEKISVDRLVQRKLPMVDKIARRLLPKIQKKEIARLKSFRSNQNKNESFINEAFTLMLEEVFQFEEVDPVEEGAALDMLKNRQDRENAARLRDARLKNRNTRVNELFIAFIQ